MSSRTILGAAAFAVGVVLADAFRPGSVVAASAGAAGLTFMAVAAGVHLRNPPPGPGSLLPPLRLHTVLLILVALAACGFCALGLRLAALRDAVVPRHQGETVTLTGLLADDPRSNGHSHRFNLAVRRAGHRAVRERVAVTVYGRLPNVELGDSVQVRGKIRRLDLLDRFDRSLARKSVVAKASASATDVLLAGKSRTLPLRAANHFRSRITAAAEDAGPGRSGLLLGLVMGDQRTIPDSAVDNFRAAGLSHLTAVSGQNVAMVMAPVMMVLTLLRFSREMRVVISLVVLGLLALVTRWEPSVLRATLMASAALTAWLFGRRSGIMHLLGLVFLALLAVDPLLLWSIGFQLSFAATAGILSMGPHFSRLLGRPLDDGPLDQQARRHGTRSVGGRLVQAAAIGLAAQLAVLPLIAWHFGRVSLVSLPANLFALPLVAPVTLLGLCGGLAALGAEDAGGPFMYLAGLFVSALQWVAGTFGGSAYAQLSLQGLSALRILAAFFAAAGGALWLRRGKGTSVRWAAPACILAALVAGLVPAAGSGMPRGVRLTFFDVGQGDAALVESASGARVLIDGGPDPAYLARRLKGMGLRRVDLVVASHGHSDHVAGLAEVLRRLNVRAAVDPGIRPPVMRRVMNAGDSSATPFTLAREGDSIRIGDLAVDFLSPSPGGRLEGGEAAARESSQTEGTALNDASLVARVRFGDECALFPGDLEEEGQKDLVEGHRKDIRCSILKAPHHGSGRLLSEFVESVDPEWVTISAGSGNDYGHPAPRALFLFRRTGARVLRTDRLGDIELEVGRQGRVTLGK